MLPNELDTAAMDADALEQRLHELLTALPDNAQKADYVARAATAYWDARSDGLCHEGAWECALQVLAPLLAKQ